MWIKRIEVRDYQGLNGACELVPGRLNVIRLGNGQGKTTIADAVVAALFGPVTEARKPTGSVDLLLSENGDGMLRLFSDFSSTPPLFQLTSPDAGKEIANLAGTSYGESRMGIPREVFEFCSGRNAEGAARAAILLDAQTDLKRRETPPAVQKALNALANITVEYPELAADPLPLESALEKIQHKIAGLESELRALKSTRERAIGDGHAAERLRQEAEAQGRRREELQRAALSAELHEVREALLRLESGEEAGKRRAERMEQLRAEGVVAPGKRLEIERLLAELRDMCSRIGDARQRVDSLKSGLEAENLAEPPLMTGTGQLEQFRAFRVRILGLRGHIEEKQIRLDSDYPASPDEEFPSEDEDLLAMLESIPESQRSDAMALVEEYLKAEAQLRDIETERIKTRSVVEASRAERERLGVVSAASVAIATVGSVAGVVLWLTALPIAGAAAGALALAAGATGLEISGRGRRKVSSRLDPALAQEVSLSGTATRLREHLEALDDSIQGLARQTGIAMDDLFRLAEVTKHLAARAPRRDAEAELKRIRTDLLEAEQEARSGMQVLTPELAQTPADSDVVALLGTAMERCQRILQQEEELSHRRNDLYRAEEELASNESERGRVAVSLLTRIAAELPVRSEPAAFSAAPLAEIEAVAERFYAACARGQELQNLEEEERLSTEASREERAAALNARAVELEGKTDSSAHAAGESSAVLRRQAEEFAQRASDLTARAAEAYQRGVTAISNCRRNIGQLRTSVARLYHIRDLLAQHAAAAALAAHELRACIEQEFASWRREVADQAGHMLEQTANGLEDYYWPGSLADPPCAFSRRTGRKLSSEEIAQLGSGVRGQAALALRLAVADHLAEGTDRFPLLLDEPFAAWDDERFVAGIRWLVEHAATGRQVLLLTGHTSRLAELDRTHFELARELQLVRFK